jgi:hypothetical protein
MTKSQICARVYEEIRRGKMLLLKVSKKSKSQLAPAQRGCKSPSVQPILCHGSTYTTVRCGATAFARRPLRPFFSIAQTTAYGLLADL